MAVVLTRKANTAALPVCLAAMDACWIYIVAWLFSSNVLYRIDYFPVPSPILLAGMELLAWLLAARMLDGTKLPINVVQAISGVVGLVVAFAVNAGIRPPLDGSFTLDWLGTAVYGIMVSLGLWFLGGYRASERPTFNNAYGTFRTGLSVIVLAAVMTAVLAGSRSQLVWAEIGSVVLWFFAFGLGALALGNRQVVREEFGSESMGSWGLILAASIGGVMIIGIISGLLGGQSLLTLTGRLVQWVIFVVGSIVYGFLVVVFGLIGLLGIDLKAIPPPPPPGDDPERFDALRETRLREEQGQTLPEVPVLGAVDVLLSIGVVLVVVLAIWLVGRGLRRTMRAAEQNTMEDRESLGGWSLLMQNMRAWLNRLLGRNKPGQGALDAVEDDLAALRGRAEYSGTLSIRQIYARLLGIAGRLGYPRARHQTPIEYLGVLATAMPELRGDLNDITAAYLEARYGPMPASAPAVTAATNAWKRAEPELKSAAARAGKQI